MRETASKSALLLSGCLRWAHPASRWYSDRAEDAEAREDGKEVHAAIHMHGLGLPYVLSNKDNWPKVNAAAKYLDEKLIPRCKEIYYECVLGINFSTGEAVLLRDIGDRAYPESDTWFYGTADVLAVLHSGTVLVADWKTGSGEGAEEQLKTLALAAREVLRDQDIGKGLNSYRPVRISTLYVTDDEVIEAEREVGVGELDGHFLMMKNALIEAREPAKPHLPVVGAHCTQLYCPHLAYCPSTHAIMDELADKGGADDLNNKSFPMEAEPASSTHAGWMAVRLRAIKRATKYFEGHLKDYVRAGNRAVYDGHEYKETGRGFMVVKEK